LYNFSLSLGVIVGGANKRGGSSAVEDDDAADADAADADAADADAADADAADADAAGNQRGSGAGCNECGCAGGATTVAERGGGVYDDAAADESRDDDATAVAERGGRIYDINTCSILLRVFVNMS